MSKTNRFKAELNAKLKQPVLLNKSGSLFTVLLFILALTLLIPSDTLPGGDAYDYQLLADSFCHEGSFSFTSFPNEMRGYFFPFLLFICRGALAFASEKRFVLLGSIALCVCCLSFIYLLCDLKKLSLRRAAAGAAAIAVLARLYWKDIIRYTLSDLYALMLIALAFAASKKAVSLALERFSFKSAAFSFAAGAALYAAYNTRTGALFILPVLPVVIIIALRKNTRGAVSCLGFLLLGALLIAAPQMAINLRHLGSISPLVFADYSDGSLLLSQLNWGMAMQKYDTFLGLGTQLADNRMVYWDAEGAALLEELAGGTIESYKEYAEVFFSAPFALILLYLRHTLNILTPLYNEVYVLNIYDVNAAFLYLNYAILFFSACFALLKPLKTASKLESPAQKLFRRGFVFALLLCVAVYVPGAVETRYAFPFIMLSYIFLFFKADFRSLLRQKKLAAACLAVWLAAGAGLWFYWNGLLSTLLALVGEAPVLRWF
ncbi:MAG: hypothetical protein Q4B42_01985 [Oscillospiraceae bacterium]|nr:hypothetical protein [Oscillospiraceae bacterium]